MLKNRIGVKNKNEIKKHKFFEGMDWNLLFKRKIQPTIDLVEVKKEANDNCSQDNELIKFSDFDYEKINSDYNRVKHFTFIRPASPKEKPHLNDSYELQ